jgi:atlastin
MKSVNFLFLIFQLEREIEESYGHYKSHNESKNIFKAANTPITLAAVAMILYMLSQILGMIGLYPFANLLNFLMMATFLLLATW